LLTPFVLQAAWAEQDEWMNAYRKPSDQQEEQHAADNSSGEEDDSGSQADDEEEAEDQEETQHAQQQRQRQQGSYAAAAADRAAARGKAAAEAAAAAGVARGRQAATSASSKQRQIGLSAADEQLIQQPFIPRASQGLPEHAIISEALAPNRAYQQQVMSSPSRPQRQQLQESENEDNDEQQYGEASDDEADCYHDAGLSHQGAGSGGGSRGGASSPFKTTIAKPFEFEAAAAVRPKSIAAVKLEQDLILKAHEEEAHYKQRYALHWQSLLRCQRRLQRLLLCSWCMQGSLPPCQL
jgi:hypothetical protein